MLHRLRSVTQRASVSSERTSNTEAADELASGSRAKHLGLADTESEGLMVMAHNHTYEKTTRHTSRRSKQVGAI